MNGNFINALQKAQETKDRHRSRKTSAQAHFSTLRRRIAPYCGLLGLAVILTNERLCENQIVMTLAVIAAALNILFLIDNSISK